MEDLTYLTEAQKKDRYQNRRRMAWISFTMICTLGPLMLLLGMFDESWSIRLDRMSFLTGTLFGVWAGIVLAYFGASAYTDTRGMK